MQDWPAINRYNKQTILTTCFTEKANSRVQIEASS